MTQIVVKHYTQATARRHLWIGLLMAAVAISFAATQATQWLLAHPMAARGLAASLVAGLATGLGAIPVLFLRRPQEALMAPMLGLTAGMMLAASLFSLLAPAAQAIVASPAPASIGLLAGFAFLAGAVVMQGMDDRLPHAHVEDIDAARVRPQLTLVVAAIALHNLPEGLAVGVAASAGADHGMTIGIALQNIPEGWIVASALLAMGATPLRAALIALASGLVEPVGGLFGVIASSLAGAALPLALCLAAGAMLWVVSHELIPSALKAGRKMAGIVGLSSGFALMTGLASVA